MTRQTSFQLTPATEAQLDALKAQGFGTTTDIIRIAIDRMAREECYELPNYGFTCDCGNVPHSENCPAHVK